MKITINEDYSGVRLDKFLRSSFKNLPLSVVYKFIRIGKIKINSKKSKPDYRLKLNDCVEIFINDSEIEKITKKESLIINKITFKILYEDTDLLIVDKPAFLASHSGTGVMENNLMDQVKFYLKNKNCQPSLINRLDRLTSGIIIIGKNPKIVRILNKMIRENQIEKHYIALIKGNIEDNEGIIKTKLKRIHEGFQHKAVISDEGKLSETNYKVIKRFKDFTLLELIIKTGRMHQIRVQFQSINHPIIGDKVYGDENVNKKFKLKHQFLHAFKIIFKHPISNKQLEITSELPKDLNNALNKL
ncbi:MAG: RluA family pseudouridine synthase [Nanoarchaeota archaeon]